MPLACPTRLNEVDVSSFPSSYSGLVMFEGVETKVGRSQEDCYTVHEKDGVFASLGQTLIAFTGLTCSCKGRVPSMIK